MPELEVRYPCPVCLGIKMEKVPIAAGGDLALDHCFRCGGVWFEAGEVQKLRRYPPESLWTVIAQRSVASPMQCHSCHTPVERNSPRCQSCGWTNVLDCPICQRPMQVATHQDVRMDACKSCKGIWLDHVELASIWRHEFIASLERRQLRSRRSGVAEDGASVLFDALIYTPDLVFHGVNATGHIVAASAEAIGNAPEAVGFVVEAAGDAAEGVFEVILEILGGLFS